MTVEKVDNIETNDTNVDTKETSNEQTEQNSNKVPEQKPGETNKEYLKRIEDLENQVVKLVKTNEDMKSEKIRAIEKAQLEALNIKTKTKEEADGLIEQYKVTVKQLQDQLAERDQKDFQGKVDNAARLIAEDLAKTNPKKARDLAEKIAKRIRLDEDGKVQVLDDKGNLTISSVETLKNDLKRDYDYLCDGVQSTGGGAHSSAQAPVKAFNEMNEYEKVALLRESPQKYNAAKLAALKQD